MRRSLLLIPLTSLSLLVGAVTVPSPSAAAPAATTATATSPPPVPSSVTARPLGRFSLGFSWPWVSTADSYELYAKDAVTGAITGPVQAAGTAGEVTGLTVGRSYVPGIRARNAAGTSAIRWGTAATVLPTGTPPAVTNVQATASTTSTQVTVRWTPATWGIQPDAYGVGIMTLTGTIVGTFAMCDHPCDTRTVEGLEPGVYLVGVAPISWSGGAGPWTAARTMINVVDGCAAGGACVTVAAGDDRGEARLRAQGLNTIMGNTDLDLLRPLRLQNVRGANTAMYARAKELGAKVTWVLSNDWHNQNVVRTGSVPRPWADWMAYWGWTWTMANGIHAQRPVDYIDVQNEPYLSYFTDATNPGYTSDQLADHINVAASAIRTADPSAKIVGPSFANYADSFMRTFLDEAVERGLRLDAVSWHELMTSGGSVNHLPSDAIEHVANVRAMLAQRPSLGTPEIHINEYANGVTAKLAGWAAGYIAAMEQADVDVAMRTCATMTECEAVGALTDATGATLAPYWVHRFYAEQTGDRVATSTTNGNVTSFATRDGDAVKVMVGRHHSCLPNINQACRAAGQAGLATQAPFDVPVQVTGLPAGATRQVVLQRIPATLGPVAAPTVVSTQTMTVSSNGTLSITLPKVADGEAWTVSVTG